MIPNLIKIYATFIKLKRKISPFSADKSALIIPPSVPGSLGDEALVLGCIKYLRENGIKKIGVVALEPNDKWKNVGKVDEMVNLKSFFKHDSLISNLSFINTMGRYNRLYFLGADVVDGYYSVRESLLRIKLMLYAFKTGAKSVILGFSFNEKPIGEIIDALNSLPEDIKLNIRDPISHKRLSKNLDHNIELTADVAFLIDPKKSAITQKVIRWIKKQKSKRRIVIGLNANNKLIQNLISTKMDNLINLFVEFTEKIYNKNKMFSFLLIPHDFRIVKGEVNDVEITKCIFNKLPGVIKEHSLVIPSPFGAAEIKEICGELDVVLSGRMHLAIACLGQGTPVGCITYQGKFKGLFQHFDLNGMTIHPKEAINVNRLVNFFIPIIEKRANIKKKIESRLPHILSLAEKNFK